MPKKKTKAVRGRGRPAKFKDSTVLSIRMGADDAALIRQVAEAAGLSSRDWAREQLIAAARRAKHG